MVSSVAEGQYRFLENGYPISHGLDGGFFLDSPTREKIDLSGVWEYSIDATTNGKTKVPGAYDFVGKVAFHRNFSLSAEQLAKFRFHLVMYGVNHAAEININGDFVGNHTGGSTSFVLPIPQNSLQTGAENLIRVDVSNELDGKKTLPLRPQVWSWRNYGGITRDVFLLATPRLYVKDLTVVPVVNDQQSTATIGITGIIDGEVPASEPDQSAKKAGVPGFQCELYDRITGTLVGRSAVVPLARQNEDWAPVHAEIVLTNPKMWSPEAPELYLVKSHLIWISGKENSLVDEYNVTTGIRQFAVRNGHFVLNGRRILLRGMNWYEDVPGHGSALSPEEQEKDIALIKSLGANVVRFIGHPPHPYMLDLCDRYGLLAFVELPLVNTPGSVLADENYDELVSTMCKEMIMRDRNHPSVAAWGFGDEFESTHPAARAEIEALVKTAHALDTRPTFFATRLLPVEGCTDLVDIAAVNVYATDLRQWKTQLEEWKTRHPHQPVVVGRFGTEVQQENRNGYSDPLSQEAQARFYLQRFDAIKTLDYDGAFVWSFNDWRGDRPSLTVNSRDPWMHQMGLVNGQREKRLAYDAVRAVLHGEKFAALPAGNHSGSEPIIYVLSGFIALIGIAYIYNASRRFRDNLNRCVLNSYNFFADVRDQRVVSSLHSTLLGLVVSVAMAIVASSIFFHFRESLVLDNLLSYLLVFDRLKSFVVRLIWVPLKFIGVMSLVFFAGLLLMTGAVLFFRTFVRTRIYLFHAYTITMWSTAPLIALVPLGMILFRIMDSPLYVAPTLVLIAVLCGWVILRLLKGIAIVFDIYPPKMYFVGLLTVVAVVALAYLYYEYSASAPMYLTFMFNTMSGA